MNQPSLFEKYGGFPRVSGVIIAFYEAVLDSDTVGDHFAAVDMRRVIDHQTQFVAGLLGGPLDYDEERLRAAHRHLRLSDADFDEMTRLFAKALRDHGFDEDDVASVVRAIDARRGLVVA